MSYKLCTSHCFQEDGGGVLVNRKIKLRLTKLVIELVMLVVVLIYNEIEAYH